MTIHLSVRYFQWNWDISSEKEISESIYRLKGIVDVINLDAIDALTNHRLQKICKSLGFKIKYISGEGCIRGHENNYNSLPGFRKMTCHDYNGCKGRCKKLFTEYPWMNLVRSFIYKEMLQYIDCDIIKLPTRSFNSTTDIKFLLDYYTSDAPTDQLMFAHLTGVHKILPLKNDEMYNEFIKYIDNTSKCSQRCGECRKCEKTYYTLLDLSEE